MTERPSRDCACNVAAVLATLAPERVQDGIDQIMDAIMLWAADRGMTANEAEDFALTFADMVVAEMRCLSERVLH